MKKIALFAVVIALILFSCDSKDVDTDNNQDGRKYSTVTFHGDPDAIIHFPMEDYPLPLGTCHLTRAARAY